MYINGWAKGNPSVYDVTLLRKFAHLPYMMATATKVNKTSSLSCHELLPTKRFFKLSAQRNETETRQLQKCFEIVVKLFCFSFISLCGLVYSTSCITASRHTKKNKIAKAYMTNRYAVVLVGKLTKESKKRILTY